MDTARQIVRWALPGWMMFLFFMIFVVVTMFVTMFIDGQGPSIYLTILKEAAKLIIPLAAVAIPLGFIVYQGYYWMYWYVPIPHIFGGKIIDPTDRGQQILSGVKDHIDFKEIFGISLTKTPSNAFKELKLFKLTDQSLATLKEKGLPTDTIDKLKPLKDKRYTAKDEFTKDLKMTIGEEQYNQHKSFILKHASSPGKSLCDKIVWGIADASNAIWRKSSFRGKHFTYKSIDVMSQYRRNWHLSESAWYLALSNDRHKTTAGFLQKRNQFLSDIYHSLGACCYALVWAYLFYIGLLVYIGFDKTLSFVLCEGIAALVNLVIFFLMYKIFKGGRIASFDALLRLKHDVITNVMLNKPATKKEMETNESDAGDGK